MSIDEATAAFFSAFDNTSGIANVDILYDVCIDEAVIINATGRPPAVYDLPEFVEPRRVLLASGRLTGFREYETTSSTETHVSIARRTSRYEKTWHEDGVAHHGAGVKIFSFLLTDAGWKIASVLWCDEAATSG